MPKRLVKSTGVKASGLVASVLSKETAASCGELAGATPVGRGVVPVGGAVVVVGAAPGAALTSALKLAAAPAGGACGR
jgi:hypothetical protein